MTVTPPSQTIPATGPSGAVATFSVTATDLVDPSPTINGCTPLNSGSTFPIGTTSGTCTATDNSGNVGSEPYSVTVVDAGTPVVTLSAPTPVEATSPAGAPVDYTASADDPEEGPLTPSCSPLSGETFPLGATTITCTATDSASNTGSASQVVTVQDTTPPDLNAPSSLALRSSEPVPASANAVQVFLDSANATDIADPAPVVTYLAPSVFPLGTSQVTFRATDASGNTTTKTASVTVSANAGIPPSATPTIDTQGPDRVDGIWVSQGHRALTLHWRNPGDPDFDHVEILRTPSDDGDDDPSLVYDGRRKSFQDRGLQEGEQYRYELRAYDRSGNASAAVAVIAVAEVNLVLTPVDGATLTKPPRVSWRKIPKASYYNIQLYLDERKVLSVWPVTTFFQLKKTWVYAGKRHRLTSGEYHVFVWPGFGPQSAARYGRMIGRSDFVIGRA